MPRAKTPYRLALGNRVHDLTEKTLVMGILNVTPDSFSDGGRFTAVENAVSHALRMVAEGADIIDIGGESTRPGATPVPPQQELDRVLPVIERLSRETDIPISIDTSKATVADEAVKAGAAMINDITGLHGDAGMAAVAARHGVPIVIMHIRGTPGDMQQAPSYQSLISDIIDYLLAGVDMAVKAGVREENIVLDPGIGFGKTLEHNLEILARLAEFKALGYPLLVGPSRKAFIGALCGGLPVSERMEGTAAAVTAAILGGANIVRVHDVLAMTRVARVADAIRKSGLRA